MAFTQQPAVDATAPMESDYVKVTVLLPKDTVVKLDQMAASAGVGGRGRVIQAMVESILESAPDIHLIRTQIAELREASRVSPRGATDQVQRVMEQLGSMTTILFSTAQLITRLNKFVHVERTPNDVPPSRAFHR